MDKTIEELFREKNSMILKDKLILDIANNDDSLQLAVKNKIILITSNTVKKINSLLKENNLEYDVKTLTELFDSYRDKIIAFVSDILDKRKIFLSESITHGNKTTYQELCDSVKEFVGEFEVSFESCLDELIHITIQEDFLTHYTFKELEQKESLIMIFGRFDNDLSKNISDVILERNANLLNVFRETSDKVLELDNKTSAKVIEKK